MSKIGIGLDPRAGAAQGLAAGAAKATDPSLPLNRLKAAFRAGRGKPPIAPASAAAITVSAPTETGAGTSQITGVVNHLFTTTDKFAVYNKANWIPSFTQGGTTYYYGISTTSCTIAFRHEGQMFELMARSADTWSIWADGEPVTTGFIDLPASAGYAKRRLTVDFGSRGTRNIVCYARTYGFAGVSIGPTDTIALLDLSAMPRFAVMCDSYGESRSTFAFLGPFAAASFRMMTADSFPLWSASTGGGSGYQTGGTANKTFADRIATMIAEAPDVMLVAGGINDSTAGLQAAAADLFASVRAALPNAVIATVGVWTPTTSYFGSGQTKHDLIFAALQGVSGPWVDIDVTRGIWTNSAGLSGSVGPAPWVTGTGKSTAPAGSGNADVNTGSDGIHPTAPVGHDYLGGHLYTGLRAGILAL